MEKKWTTYDEGFWETCPGEIIDMNGKAAEEKKPPAKTGGRFRKKRKTFLFWRAQPTNL